MTTRQLDETRIPSVRAADRAADFFFIADAADAKLRTETDTSMIGSLGLPLLLFGFPRARWVFLTMRGTEAEALITARRGTSDMRTVLGFPSASGLVDQRKALDGLNTVGARMFLFHQARIALRVAVRKAFVTAE